jgi:sulfur carrier protein ThiS
MKIKIVLKAWLPKLWDGEKERWIEVPEGATCEAALESQGIFHKEIPRFGFVSLNGKRVLIDGVLHDGDEMNVYPRMNGG